MNQEIGKHSQFVSQVDVLVKPGSEAKRNHKLYKAPSYKELQLAWEKRFQELVKNPQALLLYFSEFIDSKIEHEWRKIEDQRISQLRKKLGSKLFVFDTNDVPHRDSLLRTLTKQNITWDSSNLSLWAYGEHLHTYDDGGACVGIWGKSVKNILGVDDSNFVYPIPSLSMSPERSTEIHRENNRGLWQKIFDMKRSLLGNYCSR